MKPPLPKALTSATAICIVGIGLFFVFFRPPLLIEDLRFIGATESTLSSSAPRLADWLTLVFRVMGGFMIATGSLLLAMISGDSLRRAAGKVAIAIAGVSSIGVMTAVNFSIGSDFKWLILAFAALWAATFVSLMLEKSP